jgi:ArsR family transcriptional regulator
MCVGDISKVLNINQTTISHQLRFLKNYNLVSDKRTGKSVVYSLGTKFVNSIMLDAVDYICDKQTI